jgi:large subunit ribosomal protein L28
MARQCAICGKHPATGHAISHSAVKTKRRFLPNLQRIRVVVDGAPRRLSVCTSCLQSGRVQRPKVRSARPLAS